MGEIANDMINGTICNQCGVYLTPGEEVYDVEGNKLKIPRDIKERPIGFAVRCKFCKNN